MDVSKKIFEKLLKPSAPWFVQCVSQPCSQRCVESLSTNATYSKMSTNSVQPCQGSSNIAKKSSVLSHYSFHSKNSPQQSLWNMRLMNNLNSYEAPKGWRALHHWHIPIPESYPVAHKQPAVVVVLLGWLGCKQNHLRNFVDWYTSRGMHAITFTLQPEDVFTFTEGGKVEEHLNLLVEQLSPWLNKSSDTQKCAIFHTFSNAGWLSYGALLEKFSEVNPSLLDKIRGCVVDSAPFPVPDPQLWARGFSTALLKKNSTSVKGAKNSKNANISNESEKLMKEKPSTIEKALLVLLEKVFNYYLKLPYVDRRLSEVTDILTSKQPQCPQLYLYSSGDTVISAKSIEKFIEEQRKAGYDVRACNFMSSPHVDHYRNFPDLYSSQLTTFLEDCIPCKFETLDKKTYGAPWEVERVDKKTYMIAA